MSDTKAPIDNAELRELLSRAIKRLEHIVGCDMHFFHPDATSCNGKTSMGECNHKRTCELIFESRKALAKPQRNCDVGTETEQQVDVLPTLKQLGFWGQAVHATLLSENGLTGPNPREDIPSL